MTGHRMSSLPIAQRCGQGPRLSAISSGENALLGTAWHAHNLQPDSEAAKAAMAKLSPEERAQVLSWKTPTDLETPHGWLRYSQAWPEMEVALDLDGEHCLPDSPRCATVGHVDMHWVLGEYLYVVDAKRSEWTVADGPETLQLHSYGLALASKFGCRYYVPGIWACVEGRWWWAERAVDMWSEEADQLRATVVRAALNNDPAYVVGAHCRGCYGRSHCPAWLMPPELADTSLGALTDGKQLDAGEALRLLLLVQRAEDTTEKAKGILKEWSLKNGGIADPAAGKKWAAVRMPGRSSVDTDAMRRDGLDLSKYEKRGKDYDAMKWVKL